MEVTLAGWYLLSGLDRLVRDLTPMLQLREPEELRIDLRRLAFIGPTCMAVLLASLKKMQADSLNAEGSMILPPRSPLTSVYLYRMDVFRQLAGELSEEFELTSRGASAPAGTSETTTPLMRQEISATRWPSAYGWTMSRGQASTSHFPALRERVFHAESSVGGYVVAQGWRRRPEIEIAIVDPGVGIRASLTKNPAYADIDNDLHAITTAVQQRGEGVCQINGVSHVV